MQKVDLYIVMEEGGREGERDGDEQAGVRDGDGAGLRPSAGLGWAWRGSVRGRL